MDKNTRAMARENYGYGRWDAPYWFIGPEQGMGGHENNDLEKRVEAWLELKSQPLNDCKDFHREIGEERWHFKQPKVELQSTWTPLMRLLMTYRGRQTDNDSLRKYQKDEWGMLKGETCVIELSGLAAPNLKKAPDTEEFLESRIEIICDRMRVHPPELVVMYGRMQKKSWNKIGMGIAGREFPPDDPVPCRLPKTNILMHKRTILVCTPHPSRPIWDGTQYLVNEYWSRLGTEMRKWKVK